MPASSISASRLIGCARISPFASPRRAATAPSCRLPRSSISSTRRCRRWGAGAGTHRACWRGWSGEALLSQPPPARLGWAHIFSEHVAVDDAVEAIESVSHGDRSVRFVAAVTGPAAQACDAPACPGQAVGRMRVLLLDGAPLQLGLQCTQDVNLLGAEHAACGWTLAAGGARQRKLHGDGSGDERNDDELFENLAILDDALLDSQSLPFESPEQLFDIPAQAIPADHGECLHDSLDPVRGQQAPQDRLLARRSIDLAHLDGEQLDLRGSSGIRAVLGPLDTHAAEANGQFRPTGAAVFIRSRREIDLVAMRFRQGCHRRKQAAAAHKAAIPAGTRQKMGPRVRQARPFLINVTFAVIHDCDEGGLAQHSFRLLPALQPAMGFLRFNRKTLVVRSLGGGPAPHLRIDQPKALPALRINRQHGMHEQPHIAAVADRAEPLFAAALRLIVELARVLNREYVSTAGRRRRKHRPVRHHLRNRHGLIVKKAPKPDLLRSIISKPTNADLLPLADPLDQQLADPSASFVPKIAKPCLRHRRPLESRWPGQNHAEFSPCKRNRTATSMNRTATSVPNLARRERVGVKAAAVRNEAIAYPNKCLRPLTPALSPLGLGWAHIFSEHVAVDDAVEAIESVSHGDRSVRFVAAVTGPAAQACDAPACPGQAVGRMRVLLLDGAPLQLGLQCTQDVNLLGAEHAACGWTLAAGGARQRKLHGDGSGDERNDDELFENLAILDDALLDSQSLPFESPEQLFDIPAQAIPADHGECLHDSLDPVRGQQAPQDRLLARRSIDLAHLDGEQLDLRGSSGIRAVLGPLDTHAAEANGQFRPTGAAVFIRSRREIDLVAMRFRQGCHRRKQAAAAHKAAIPAGTRQKMGPRVRQARPFLINVTFAVIHDCDEGGLAQHSFRLLPALQPAMGFLRFNRKTLVVRSLGGGPAPHLRIDQPKALPALRINRQHGMHEQPHIAAVADRAEPLFAAALRLIVELARVLNREYVSTAGRRRRKHRPVRHHLRNRHGLIVKKAPKPDLLRSIISKPTNADLLPLADPLDQQLADPSASFVPKIAKPCLRHRRPLESRWPGQ